MKKIKVGKYTILVSDKDFSIVSKLNLEIWEKGDYKAVRIKPQSLARFLLSEKNSKIHIDHINRNPLDNRKCNLRKCNIGQNLANRRKPSNNTSGYKGVILNKEKGKWYAQLRKNGKKYYGKLTENKIKAAKDYDNLAKIHFNKFAYVNFSELNTKRIFCWKGGIN